MANNYNNSLTNGIKMVDNIFFPIKNMTDENIVSNTDEYFLYLFRNCPMTFFSFDDGWFSYTSKAAISVVLDGTQENNEIRLNFKPKTIDNFSLNKNHFKLVDFLTGFPVDNPKRKNVVNKIYDLDTFVNEEEKISRYIVDDFEAVNIQLLKTESQEIIFEMVLL